MAEACIDSSESSDGMEDMEPCEAEDQGGVWSTQGKRNRQRSGSSRGSGKVELAAKKPRDDKRAEVLFIKEIGPGNITRRNPVALKSAVDQEVGRVERIFVSGQSLKIICSSSEQKQRLLQEKELTLKGVGRVSVEVSGPRGAVEERGPRGVITGISQNISD